MWTRLTGGFTALLMAVPLCWCCLAPALIAAEPEECPACHQFAEPADAAKSAPAQRDCPCCASRIQRELTPKAAVAPRLVPVDLQTAVWLPASAGPFAPSLTRQATGWRQERAPPGRLAPVYQRHCARLL